VPKNSTLEHFEVFAPRKLTPEFNEEFQYDAAKISSLKANSVIYITCLKAMLISLLSSMSLNIPSSLDVNPPPHSCFSLDNMLFSASTLADFPTRSLFAKSYENFVFKTLTINVDQAMLLFYRRLHTHPCRE